MNIEILSAYIHAGRNAAEAVLSDEDVRGNLSNHAVKVLELLRNRACRPDTATEIVDPVRQTISAQEAVARDQIRSTSSMTPGRDAAEKRKILLRSMQDLLTAMEAESEHLLDRIAAEALNRALAQRFQGPSPAPTAATAP